MTHTRKRFLCLGGILCLILVSGVTLLGSKLRASLPVLSGERVLPGLASPVKVTADRYGIPTITAHSRLDALRALGYVSARDRLFQMDLLRRHSAGRLAEIFGETALPDDIWQRSLGFRRLARSILAALPNDQREALHAYATGVNTLITHLGTPPFEFVLLGYRPDLWTPEDSILVLLNMFQTLSGDEDDERMLTIMQAVLPSEVVAFLTPDTDAYTTVRLGGINSHRPIRPIPVQALVALRRQPRSTQATRRWQRSAFSIGSNGWAVGSAKTADGRAILANDMHLPFSVPNLWYRAVLRYGDIDITGVLVPGVPVVVAGSNGHVAWGLTNSKSDVLDLVRLQLNPANPEEYRTPAGWQRFDVVPEAIRVKGGQPVVHTVRQTIWGPVSPQPLLSQPVAIHWTALDPQAVDLGLLAMDAVTTLAAAVDVSNRFRSPPLHVLLADRSGRIAWTYSGRIPIRRGFDGSASTSWADGDTGWHGYIPAPALPRVLDPPVGFVVSANQRLLGKDYPYVLGHNFDYSYRAYWISQRLHEMEHITERDMLRLQLDTTSHFYDFYQQLALAVLSDVSMTDQPLLAAARDHIRDWNGQAEVTSVGFTLLVQFRETLLAEVFAPFLVRCQEADAEFSYAWHNRETPLRLLLTARPPELLPDPTRYPTWEAFLRGQLAESLQQLFRAYHTTSLAQLTWGRLNTASIAHPLARALPFLGRVLNMPREALPGCAYCIRTTGPDWGASERLVVSPGRHDDGIFQMPGGQSGHPLSPHYSDQHRFWVQGIPLPFVPGPAVSTLVLEPDSRELVPIRVAP